MKNIIIVWDDIDDRCESFFVSDGDRFEIIVQKDYNKFKLIIKDDNDEVILRDVVDSLFEINGIMLSVFDMQINLPDEKILNEIEGYVA